MKPYVPQEFALQGLAQKYPSAYYVTNGRGHYVMFEGVRTAHGSMDEALGVCEYLNRLHGLPNINVHTSSMFPRKEANHG